MGSINMVNWFFLTFFVLASLVPFFPSTAAELVDLPSADELKEDLSAGLDFVLESSANATHAATDYLADRRELVGKVKTGPCMPTNIIDKCWRCNANWADNRQQLAKCVLGFGQHTTGGLGGPIYVVTDPSDNDLVNPKPGTLRHAVIQTGPLWIIFDKPMTITLQQELMMTSDKTIDGRGVSVTITKGAGITLQNVQNIIIHNLHIHDIVPTKGGMIRDSVAHYGLRTADDGDGISLFNASNVWLDHLSMSHCADGLIDAIEGSTGVTISNCHFTDQDKAMLFGGRDNNPIDQRMQITLAYNHFGKRMMQRMPRCRTGFFHVVNNDYTHWDMYAIGGSSGATIISQGNRFKAHANLPIGEEYKKEITHRDGSIPQSEWMKWTWVSDGDLFQNGAHFTPSGDPNGAQTYKALELIRPEPATRVEEMVKDSGYLPCRINVPC